MGDPEGHLLTGGALHVLKVHKDSLSCLRTQIYRVLGILGHALEGLEHQVKLADIREIMLAAAGTGDIILVNVLLHLLLGPGIHRSLGLNAVLFHIALNQLIRTETLLTSLTVHQRIGKASQMSGGNPGLRVHQDCTVHPYIVGTLLNKLLPPGFLYVIL